jgi:hypothetical protein
VDRGLPAGAAGAGGYCAGALVGPVAICAGVVGGYGDDHGLALTVFFLSGAAGCFDGQIAKPSVGLYAVRLDRESGGVSNTTNGGFEDARSWAHDKRSAIERRPSQSGVPSSEGGSNAAGDRWHRTGRKAITAFWR